MTYQDCLDLIFKSFIEAKPLLIDKYDRDVRDPHRLLSFAKEQGILPDPQRVLKVTGSKGKGTTARMMAVLLQLERPNEKTGLLVSPEELEHLDRISINGNIITESDFCRITEMLMRQLPLIAAPDYYSPYGLFLLIGLVWFQEQDVHHMVIECGRGVKYDEGGQLPAKVGVVTNVYLEHADKLGPDIENIRADKMSIKETCEDFITEQVHQSIETKSAAFFPDWFEKCRNLASMAVSKYLGEELKNAAPFVSTSFSEISLANGSKVIFEAMVTGESADRIYWQNLKKRHGDDLLVFLSHTDDKKFQKISTFYAALDIAPQHIILTGERGNLCYDATKKSNVFYIGDYNDSTSFRNALMPTGGKVHAFVGTQTFIRLVKKAFAS